MVGAECGCNEGRATGRCSVVVCVSVYGAGTVMMVVYTIMTVVTVIVYGAGTVMSVCHHMFLPSCVMMVVYTIITVAGDM